jgi:hypothetical protein
VPRVCEFYPGISLTTEDKARKNLSQGKKNLSQGTVYLLHIYAFKKNTTVVAPIFMKSVLARLRFEENYQIEFHENPTYGFVADAWSQKDGRAEGRTWTPHTGLFFLTSKSRPGKVSA